MPSSAEFVKLLLENLNPRLYIALHNFNLDNDVDIWKRYNIYK